MLKWYDFTDFSVVHHCLARWALVHQTCASDIETINFETS